LKPPELGLLDTNTLILLDRLDESAPLPAVALISTITLAELGVGPHVTDDPVQKAERQLQVQNAEASFEPIPFDVEAARAFAQVAGALRTQGRKTASRSFDAMIAAIAISRGLPLYTCNAADFAGIDGLEVVAVPNPLDPVRPS